MSKKFYYNNHLMRCFSVKQPWGSLLVNGTKNIENRTWGMKLNKDICKNWLLIHASGSFDSASNLKKIKPKVKKILGKFNWKKFPKSAIIGMIHISKIEKNCDLTQLWASGPVCWHVDAVIDFIKPIPYKGALSFWNPHEEDHQLIRDEITRSLLRLKFHDNPKNPENNPNEIQKINSVILNFKKVFNFPPNFTNYIIGNNKWKDIKIIRNYLYSLPTTSKIIVNSSRGFESLVYLEAKKLKLDIKMIKADWKKYGSKAGDIREKEILKNGISLITVFQMVSSDINNSISEGIIPLLIIGENK